MAADTSPATRYQAALERIVMLGENGPESWSGAVGIAQEALENDTDYSRSNTDIAEWLLERRHGG